MDAEIPRPQERLIGNKRGQPLSPAIISPGALCLPPRAECGIRTHRSADKARPGKQSLGWTAHTKRPSNSLRPRERPIGIRVFAPSRVLLVVGHAGAQARPLPNGRHSNFPRAWPAAEPLGLRLRRAWPVQSEPNRRSVGRRTFAKRSAVFAGVAIVEKFPE